MSVRSLYGVVLLVIFCGLEATEIQFKHNMKLDDAYHMHWTFDDEYITVKVVVNTTGWVSWGLSSAALMKGDDLVIGWIDRHGNTHFYDLLRKGRYQPSIDLHQDYHLLEMTEEGSSTEITFRRKLKTTDDDDIPITSDTMIVHWSWGNEDPRNEKEIPLYVEKGSKPALLLDYSPFMSQHLPKQYKTFDIRIENHKIEDQRTTYWCKIYKIPDMGLKKQHVVKIDTFITKASEGIASHINLYQCPPHLNETDVYIGEDYCLSPNMKKSCLPYFTIFARKAGDPSFYYPSNVGFSLNSAGDPQYVRLEVHYDNVYKKGGIVDSSGFRLTYTEELRDFDCGIILAGPIPMSQPNYTQIIPQHQKKFTSYGFCSSNCLGSFEYTKIFAVLPHLHENGRKITVRLMNETTGEEVLTIMQDSSLHPNLTRVRFLKEPIELHPGYRIDVECTYDTTHRDTPVVNGFGSDNEMCLASLWTYPKVSLKTCYSHSLYNYTHLGRVFGWTTDQSGRINSSFLVKNKDYIGAFFTAPLLDPNFWILDPTRVKKIQQLSKDDPYVYICQFDKKYPMFGKFQNAPRVLLSASNHHSADSYFILRFISEILETAFN